MGNYLNFENKRIFKYEPTLTEIKTIVGKDTFYSYNEFKIPSYFKRIKANIINGKLTLWGEVFDCYNNDVLNTHRYIIIPTGGYLPTNSYWYVDTLFIDGFVWHIYEV